MSAKKKTAPATVRVDLNDLLAFEGTAPEGVPAGTVSISVKLRTGNKEAARDLLYGVCQVLEIGGAYNALRELVEDRKQLAKLTSEYIARETLKAKKP